MIMEYSEHRAVRTREPRMPDDEFLCIKGYLVPRDALSETPEQAVDLAWLDPAATRA